MPPTSPRSRPAPSTPPPRTASPGWAATSRRPARRSSATRSITACTASSGSAPWPTARRSARSPGSTRGSGSSSRASRPTAPGAPSTGPRRTPPGRSCSRPSRRPRRSAGSRSAGSARGPCSAAAGLPKDLTSMTVAGGRVVSRPMNGAVEGMLAVLEDPRAEDADSAVAGLVARYETQGPAALRPHKDRFRKLLADRDPGLRRVAAWCLARTGDLDVVPALIAALTDPDQDVVDAARPGPPTPLPQGRRATAPPPPRRPSSARRPPASGGPGSRRSARSTSSARTTPTTPRPGGRDDRLAHDVARPGPRRRAPGADRPRRVALRPGHLDADGRGRRRGAGRRLAGAGLPDQPGVCLARDGPAGDRRRLRRRRRQPRGDGRLDREDRRGRRRGGGAGLEQRGGRRRLRGAVGPGDPRRHARLGGRGGPGGWPRSTSAPSCPPGGPSPAAGAPRSSAPAGPASASGPATAASPASSAGASSTTPARPSTSTPGSSTRWASSWPSSPGPTSSPTSPTSPATTPTKRLGTGQGDHRLFFLWQGRGRKASDVALLQKAGIDVGEGVVIQFYPDKVEEALAQLEVRYKGRQPAEIRVTRFAVVPRGDGYGFEVLAQETLR